MAINSKWTDKDREIILDLLASGKSLREICRVDGMPSDMLVRKWARLDPDFGSQYARAREDGMDAMADELLAIADDKSEDYKINADGVPVLDREAIERAKIRIAARQWTMSKIAPKRYGDKITTALTDGDGNPLATGPTIILTGAPPGTSAPETVASAPKPGN